jgi:hypothetical protein
MKIHILVFTALLFAWSLPLFAQDQPVHPVIVSQGTYWGLSRPLRDIPPMTADERAQMDAKALNKMLNAGLKYRNYPYAATALPKGPDAVWQKSMGTVKSLNDALIVNFEGQSSPYFPPDDNGTVGPNHYMQTINCVYAIYSKTGALLAGPTNLNQLFGNVPGANRNDGDPIILYDEQADRYLVTEFSLGGGQNYMLMAVSATNDPTGTWHQYSFPVASMPDYPKFSIWRDGYYMGDNNGGDDDIYVFERTPMLTGGTAQMVGFSNPWRPQSVDGFMCVPPVDNDGTFAPTGSPGLYIAFNDDAIGGGDDELWIYELAVNWTSPSSSTFIRSQQLAVEPFDCNFGNNWNNITQKGTGQKVDGIPQVIMNVPQYRNFGGYQTIVCCHTVDVDATNHAGIRWYELRRTTGLWTVRQQSTYAPDMHNRWMGSIMLNSNSTIGMGYSVSSTEMYPSIFYCGQSPAAYNAANNTLDIAEDTIQNGANSQTSTNRWGDYSLLSIDPTDNKTFWFTTQYVGSGGSRKTKIASFLFQFGPTATTQTATEITGTTATLHGFVNPQGLETTYRFEWGTSALNMTDSTTSVSLGSGNANIDVSATISGLTPAKKYFFVLRAFNPSGIVSGGTLNFTTGAAPTLLVSPPNQNVTTAPGTAQYMVSSNTSWTVVSDASWCTVTPSGINNDTIFAAFDENPVVGSRIANITVTGAGVTPIVVTLTQAGIAPILLVSPPNRPVTVAPGSADFSVTSNTSWTVVSDAAWCIPTPSGTGSGTISAAYSENTSTMPRVANITVTANGISPVTVTVTQEGVSLMLAVSPPVQAVTSAAGTTAFSVTSNAAWTAVSDVSWCTVTASGSGNGTIVADYSVNTTDQARIATISVTVPTLPVQTVTVNQARSGIGMEEQTGNGIRIYPNPNRGIFRIVTGGTTGLLEVTVQDMNGKIYLKKQFKGEKEYSADLSSAPQGTYNIVLKSGNDLSVRKLVIMK